MALICWWSVSQTSIQHKHWAVSLLVSWCFKPSQPQRITSGPRGTLIRRHTVERTKKAQLRPGKLSEKTESCRDNVWNEIQVPQEKNRHKNRAKGVGKLCWFMSRTQTLTSPTREGEPAGTLARLFWPDLKNGKHDHTTAVCVSLRSSGVLRVVQLPSGSWHGLPRW